MTKKIRDRIDPELKFSLVEDTTEVDGVHILAKVRGEFFVPDGKSRNGRFYPKSLWERVISDKLIKTKLANRTMFGTVGHDEELNDKAIRDGLVSHFMTSIEIDSDNKGMGEALVIGTPAGKILNTVLRAGSKLSVSSRADGTFKGRKDGLPIVDEATYNLSGWDFVIDPGFLEANPSIAESIDKEFEHIKGDLEMEKTGIEKTLVEHIANENTDLKISVKNLVEEVETLKENNITLQEENSQVKGELEKLEESEKSLNEYKELGSVEEIKEAKTKLEEANKTLSEYSEMCESPEHTKTIMEKAHEFIKAIKEEFGSIKDIKEKFEVSEKLKADLEELGGFEKVKEALEEFDKTLSANEAKELATKTTELAKELGLSEEKITELLGKYSETDIKELFKTVTESNDSDKFVKKTFKEDNKDEDNSEEVYESKILGTNRTERIAEKL